MYVANFCSGDVFTWMPSMRVMLASKHDAVTGRAN
jgi:hypothetical protein